MLTVSCKNTKRNSWQSHHCGDFICRKSPWLTPMPQYTVECLPWQYVQAVFRRTQKAVTLDCFQRRLSGPMAWVGRCPSLAPPPKNKFIYMLWASSEVSFKICEEAQSLTLEIRCYELKVEESKKAGSRNINSFIMTITKITKLFAENSVTPFPC